MADIRKGSRKQPDYLSYLLRLWPAEDQGHAVWRALLKSAGTGEQMAFASLEDLLDYLRAHTTAVAPDCEQEKSRG